MSFRMFLTYTDTQWDGSPNYAWVRREVIDVDRDASQRTIMRKAKAAVGLTNVRGVTESLGGEYVFRPYGASVALFVSDEV